MKVESYTPVKHKSIKTNTKLNHPTEHIQKAKRSLKTEPTDIDLTNPKGFKQQFERLQKLLIK